MTLPDRWKKVKTFWTYGLSKKSKKIIIILFVFAIILIHHLLK